MAHNAAPNSSDNVPSYPPTDQYSDIVASQNSSNSVNISSNLTCLADSPLGTHEYPNFEALSWSAFCGGSKPTLL